MKIINIENFIKVSTKRVNTQNENKNNKKTYENKPEKFH